MRSLLAHSRDDGTRSSTIVSDQTPLQASQRTSDRAVRGSPPSRLHMQRGGNRPVLARADRAPGRHSIGLSLFANSSYENALVLRRRGESAVRLLDEFG